jgi:ABC-2 type transport system permease protein
MAMVLRYLYLLRSSWPRILELMYWPAVQLSCGASSRSTSRRTPAARVGGIFIGAALPRFLPFASSRF